MKPIEAGCRAMVVNTNNDNDGTIVLVGAFLGELNDMRENNLWSVDKPMTVVSGHGKGNQVYHAPERCLQRIDDYDGNEKTSWDSLVDDDGNSIWNPDKRTIEV